MKYTKEEYIGKGLVWNKGGDPVYIIRGFEKEDSICILSDIKDLKNSFSTENSITRRVEDGQWWIVNMNIKENYEIF